MTDYFSGAADLDTIVKEIDASCRSSSHLLPGSL